MMTIQSGYSSHHPTINIVARSIIMLIRTIVFLQPMHAFIDKRRNFVAQHIETCFIFLFPQGVKDVRHDGVVGRQASCPHRPPNLSVFHTFPTNSLTNNMVGIAYNTYEFVYNRLCCYQLEVGETRKVMCVFPVDQFLEMNQFADHHPRTLIYITTFSMHPMPQVSK